MRRVIVAALLLVAGCGKSPDPAATSSARDIDAAMQKAVADTDAATRDAAARPAIPAPAPRPANAPEQTPGGAG